ncbi:MAG: RagB/SusD family nutrient uptake outer membrane protein [Prevotella sp.]|jgi:hypothetical protein|nr:RagB/SusD family nutrient uptake outer membrane protein [Prevotella sp.]
MKRFNKIIVAALLPLMFGFSSCSDSFFDNDPIGSFDEQSFWKNESQLRSWVAGVYSGVQQTLGENYILWGESRSDNFLPTIYGGDAYQYNLLTPDASSCSWNNLYGVISRCNMGLANIDRVPGLTEANLNIYKGQLYAVRAWMYFYAIRVWGDVPLILQSWDGSSATRYNSRTPVATVRAEAIEKDLEQALALLPADVSTALTTGNCFYFNQASARALRMDVDMWFRDNYQRVIDDSDAIDDLKKYSLVTNQTDWRNIFLSPESSKETIFTLYWDLYTVNGTNPYGAQMGTEGKNPMFWVSNEVFNIMLRDKNDVRFWGVLDTLTIYNASQGANKHPITEGAIHYFIGTATHGHQVMKFSAMTAGAYGFEIVSASKCEYKLPLYRYADVLLLRAEALNKRNNPGDAEEAISIVNKIRQRCGNRVVANIADYPVKDGYGANSRERLILDERQVEFYGEGKRWYDLRRCGDDVFYTAMDNHMYIQQNVKGDPMIGFPKDGRELWPLHRSVFSSNPSLVGHQNPPYSE